MRRLHDAAAVGTRRAATARSDADVAVGRAYRVPEGHGSGTYEAEVDGVDDEIGPVRRVLDLQRDGVAWVQNQRTLQRDR